MRTVFLRTSIPWFGAQSGYEQLTRHLPAGTTPVTIAPTNRVRDRLIGKLVSIRRGYGHAPQAAVAALRRFETCLASADDAIGHVLYGDDFVRFIPRSPQALARRMVMTFHQPPSQWPADLPPLADHALNGIVLYSRDLAFFTRFLGRPPTVILHGVDVDFFRPAERPPPPKRILYSGVHLRNTPMLRAVIEILSHDVPDLQFDLLVPPHRRDTADLRALGELPRVAWHAGLSDEQLRALYQSSALLLLPMTDSGANTAVVEALASGVPIVTTDVGGIGDYGGDSVFPLVRDGDVDGMVALVTEFLESSTLMDRVRTDCRRFAEDRLNWPLAARQHVEVYERVRRRSAMQIS